VFFLGLFDALNNLVGVAFEVAVGSVDLADGDAHLGSEPDE
jgi:hypothetical protein